MKFGDFPLSVSLLPSSGQAILDLFCDGFKTQVPESLGQNFGIDWLPYSIPQERSYITPGRECKWREVRESYPAWYPQHSGLLHPNHHLLLRTFWKTELCLFFFFRKSNGYQAHKEFFTTQNAGEEFHIGGGMLNGALEIAIMKTMLNLKLLCKTWTTMAHIVIQTMLFCERMQQMLRWAWSQSLQSWGTHTYKGFGFSV